MKKYCVFVAGTVLMILVSSFKFTVPADDEVSYPAGYRGWTHVKSTILGPNILTSITADSITCMRMISP